MGEGVHHLCRVCVVCEACVCVCKHTLRCDENLPGYPGAG